MHTPTPALLTRLFVSTWFVHTHTRFQYGVQEWGTYEGRLRQTGLVSDREAAMNHMEVREKGWRSGMSKDVESIITLPSERYHIHSYRWWARCHSPPIGTTAGLTLQTLRTPLSNIRQCKQDKKAERAEQIWLR